MIYMKLNELPPSSNQAYAIVGKMMVLTSKGRKFKKESTAYLAKTYPLELARLKPNRPLVLYARFHLLNLQNKGWPEKAESRYKKFDASNRVKLLEDVLKDVAAVDDSNNMMFIPHKIQGAVEHTEIWIWDLETEGCPFHEAALSLR